MLGYLLVDMFHLELGQSFLVFQMKYFMLSIVGGFFPFHSFSLPRVFILFAFGIVTHFWFILFCYFVLSSALFFKGFGGTGGSFGAPGGGCSDNRSGGKPSR